MVRPAKVIELDDFAYLGLQCLVEHFELASDQVLHQALARDQDHFNVLLALVEAEALSNLRGPVLVALDLSVLLGLSQVDDQPRVLLVNHPPEVLLGLGKRTLGCDEGLVVCRNCGVDIVCIDVRVVNIGCSLHQSHLSMLEWLQVRISIKILSCCLLVIQVLLCLGQFPQKSELCVEVPHESLPFVLGNGNALLNLLDLFELLDPLVRQVLAGLRSFNEDVLQVFEVVLAGLVGIELLDLGDFDLLFLVDPWLLLFL